MKSFNKWLIFKPLIAITITISPIIIATSCSQNTIAVQKPISFKQLQFPNPVNQTNFYQQINAHWIITNQSLLVDQNQFHIDFEEQVSQIESALIKNQLVVKFVLNGTTRIDNNENWDSSYLSVLINDVDPQIQPLSQWQSDALKPIQGLVVDAKTSQISFRSLSNDPSEDQAIPLAIYDAITLAKQSHIFDLEWFFTNKELLFHGGLDLITSANAFYFPDGQQVEVEAAADGRSLKMYIGIKALNHFQNQSVGLDNIVVPISIVNLKPISKPEIDPNQLPTGNRPVVLANQLGLFGQVDQVIKRLDQKWAFQYRRALLTGMTSLIKNINQINNFQAERLNANSIRINFKLAPLSYLNDKQQIGQLPKPISIIIIGFDQGLTNRPIISNPNRPQPGNGDQSQLIPPPLPPLISASSGLQKALQNLNQQLVNLKLIKEQLTSSEFQAINLNNVVKLFNQAITSPGGYRVDLIKCITKQINDGQGQLAIQYKITQISLQKSLTSEVRVFQIAIKD